LFGQQQRRQTISGKWQNVLERLGHGQHVFRTYYKHSFLRLGLTHRMARMTRMKT
jgi:hypothetical protein